MRQLKAWMLSQFKLCFPLQAYRYKKQRFEVVTVQRTSECKSKWTLGILKEFANYHLHYVRACEELSVSYRLIDTTSSDWLKASRIADCDAFLVWPSAFTIGLRQMYDERLRVLIEECGKYVYPSYPELWLWESKRRMHLWLEANDVPHPQTWVFYDYDEAHEFCGKAQYPILTKPDFGDCSKGIRVLRTPEQARRHIRRMFGRGITLPGSFKSDRQWGSVVFQEFLRDAMEWRVARIGESYFGYMKLRQGDFASGSGLVAHGRPTDELLTFTQGVCEKGAFTSMGVDVFCMPDGRLLVNELQTVFGLSHAKEGCIVDGKPGRMVRNNGHWGFEAGCFSRNHLCNLRVAHVIDMLNRESPA